MNKLIDHKKDIINDYNQGLNINQVSKKYNSNYSTMRKFLLKFNNESIEE